MSSDKRKDDASASGKQQQEDEKEHVEKPEELPSVEDRSLFLGTPILLAFCGVFLSLFVLPLKMHSLINKFCPLTFLSKMCRLPDVDCQVGL